MSDLQEYGAFTGPFYTQEFQGQSGIFGNQSSIRALNNPRGHRVVSGPGQRPVNPRYVAT